MYSIHKRLAKDAHFYHFTAVIHAFIIASFVFSISDLITRKMCVSFTNNLILPIIVVSIYGFDFLLFIFRGKHKGQNVKYENCRSKKRDLLSLIFCVIVITLYVFVTFS